MDIFIKSFNRPYCLDRCIYSIQKYVTNNNYNIIVLDDGTPEKYLTKISKKYSGISFLTSKKYSEKVNAIENDAKNISSEIPIDLWLNAAKNGSDYFLLLEDDIWLTDYINLDELHVSLKENKLQLLKLFWLGNPKLISDKTIKNESKYSIYEPKLYTKHPFLYRCIFVLNRFEIRRVLKFLGIYSDQKSLNYYAIYSVAGTIFNKNYFLSLWKNHTNTVSEKLQLHNAIKFLKNNKEVNFGRTHKEIVKTSFSSAATNQHKNYENVTIDMFAFNKVINESWFKNEFEIANDFPKDLNPATIYKILQERQHPNAQPEEWKKWTQSFKSQYTSFGCVID